MRGCPGFIVVTWFTLFSLCWYGAAALGWHVGELGFELPFVEFDFP